ncbi:VWA domain-containing protein [Gordonia neofelifaecis]|uniref:von Willebrand factor type A n=1 Tax=Gordonia neofelifaecis NRRL B-59395 TaxID=644548 RepID=F1YGC3_9ACTN|nr:VWA domain-containing protein [Gordonia neofelifaecis]EGD56142.1 von Willebrand factor type A [Gordonia neofelifaecis NRRL B-59395]
MGQHHNAGRSSSGSPKQPADRAGSRRTPLTGTRTRVGLSVALAVLLAGGVYAVWDMNRADCSENPSVSVIVDRDAADYVTRLAKETSANSCFDYSVEAVDPSHTNVRLAQKNAPEIWVAESQARVRQVGTALGRSWTDVGPSLGTTPVVVTGRQLPAMPAWTDVLQRPELRMNPPAKSDVSNAAVVGALSEVSGGSLTHRDLVQVLTKRALMMNDNDSSPDLVQVAASSGPTAALTTERAYTKFTRENPDAQLEAAVPGTGTVSLDYRAVNVAPAADQTVAGDAIEALVATLQTDKGKQIRQSEAVRSADGEPLPDNEGVDGVTVIKPPARELVDNILRKWTALTQPIRALVAQDVSGSMEQDAGGRSRAALLREASLFGLQQFPKNTALGYWEFSIDRGGKGQDYREVMPIAPISDKTDGRTNRDLLADAIRQTLGNVHGGTGLYDTALAAFKTVYDSYDPAYSNSVIIMTDGRNEDRDSITLQHLVSELNIMKNPARRIPIIAVGISEDADADALKQIADATGGSSFIARDPKDIPAILLQAVSYRVEAA